MSFFRGGTGGLKTMRATFRSHERLSRSTDIVRARRQGRKKVGRWLVLWTYRRAESPPHAPRFGVLVSRKDGIAVKRNLFKRRMREIFRLYKTRLPRGWDFLAAPKTGIAQGGLFPPPYGELSRDFQELARPFAPSSSAADV